MAKQTSAQLFRSYVWLVDTIYTAGHITRAEINRKWSQNYSLNELHENAIPERTFHNWIWAIQDLFQINIECSRKLGGAYYIEDAEDLERGGIRQWLINTFAVNNLINESHHLKHQILFEKIPSGQRFLTTIIEAMRDKVQLKMTYHGYHKDHASTFMVKPYCVKVYRQRWYMLAESEKPGMVVYALDRIDNIEVTEEQYKMPVDFNPEEFFAPIVGVSDAGKKPKFVTIRVNSWQANYFRSLPLHSSQEETERTDEYSIFKYYLVPNYEFKQELRAHGSAVQVQEPQKLADEMKVIKDEAVYQCVYATSINIPSSVEIIDDEFNNCIKVEDVYVNWLNEESIVIPSCYNEWDGYYAFRDIASHQGPKGATLHVPTGMANVYRQKLVWQDFGTIVEDATPIEEVRSAHFSGKKVLMNGKLLINQGDKFYSILGLLYQRK